MAEVDTLQPRGGAGVQRQLPLEVRLRDDATFDNYLALPAAAPLVRALAGQLESDGERVVYLFGPPGSGKSHLLQASCHLSWEQSLYLPLDELRSYSPQEVLQGVESMDRVCLDDLHAVAGQEHWEMALFNLYNSARQSGCALVLSADAAPRALPVKLPDLRSRLAWGVVYQVPRCDDEEKAAILQYRAARRGMPLSPEVAAYIVSRAPRGMEQLLSVLDQLDEASLVQQRALSIPFVKQALGW